MFDDSDILFKLMIGLVVLQVLVTLAYFVVTMLTPTKPSQSQGSNTGLPTKNALEGVARSWDQLLGGALQEQLSYGRDSLYLSESSEEDLQSASPAVEQLRKQLKLARLAEEDETVARLTLLYREAAASASAVKECARHFQEAAKAADESVCLLDLRPAGQQMEEAWQAFCAGDYQNAVHFARRSSEMSLVARRQMKEMQSLVKHLIPETGKQEA